MINDGGEVAVNVNKVAKAAGVTVPSLYHFFGSREGLIEEAQAFRFEEGMRLVGVALNEQLALATTKAKYQSILRKYLESVTSDGQANFRAARNSVLVSAINNPRLAKRITQIQLDQVTRVEGYFRVGKSHGWIKRDVDIATIVTWVMTLLNGRILIDLDPKKRHNREWNKMFVDSVMRAIKLE